MNAEEFPEPLYKRVDDVLFNPVPDALEHPQDAVKEALNQVPAGILHILFPAKNMRDNCGNQSADSGNQENRTKSDSRDSRAEYPGDNGSNGGNQCAQCRFAQEKQRYSSNGQADSF